MAIRFQNTQQIQTNAFTAFTGADTFTWAFRLLVDSMTFTGEAPFFSGQYYGMFSLRFAAVSGSNIVMTAGVTRAAGNLTVPAFMVPRGRACHLAGVYDGIRLRIFLNGYQIAVSDSGVAAPVNYSNPLILGVQAAAGTIAVDYYLDDVYLWRNVALSTTRLRELRDGLPFAVDPGPAFMAWSMDGTAGQGVKAADPGVRFTGVAPAIISTPPPVFSDRSLAYSPVVRVQEAAVAPSGKGIIIRLEDSLGPTPIAPSSLVANPTLTIDGAPVSLAAPGPLWQANTLPYLYYPLATPVAPDAELRLSAAPGWALAGTLGEVQGMTDLVVANPGPAILPELPLTPKQMVIGWNVPTTTNFSQVSTYANLLRQASRYFGPQNSAAPPTITYDPVTKFPSLVSGGEAACRVTLTSSAPFDPRGYANLLPGPYVLLWDGTGNARLMEEIGHGFGQVSADLVGPANKRRTYNLTLSTHPATPRGAQLRLVISGQVANVRIYGPGTPPDGSEKFHPEYLRMLEGSRIIRFMDPTSINNSSWANTADLPDRAQFTFDTATPFKFVGRTIASIGPHNNADGYFFSGGRVYLLITTTTPHGIRTGQMVYFTNLTGGPDGDGRVKLAGGAKLDLAALTNEDFRVHCRVLSPTTLAVSFFTGISGSAGQPSTTQAFGGQVRLVLANTIPFEDCVEVANRVGADPWICVPHAFTDEAVAAMAASLVATLDPGRKLRVEYTNEHWNLATAFQQSEFCAGMGALAGLLPSQWYAKRSGEVHAIFAAALAAAGRAGDLVRVFGSQAVNPGVTSQIVNYCVANAIPVDEIAIAPYFYNAPGNFPARWAALDAEQAHDLSDLALLRFKSYTAQHRATLQASYPAARVVCYEGGMEMGVPTQNFGADSAAVGALSRSWARHPRVRRTVLQYCQQLEDEGCAAFVYYGMAGPFPDYSGLPGGATWFVYQRTGEPAGLGDGSDGLFDNRTNLQDLGRNVSVIGKAVQEWMGMMAVEENDAEVNPRPLPVRGRITPAQLRGRRARPRPGGR